MWVCVAAPRPRLGASGHPVISGIPCLSPELPPSTLYPMDLGGPLGQGAHVLGVSVHIPASKLKQREML